MKIDGSEQRKIQRGVCSRAHGKREAHIGYKLSRGEGGFWTVFGTATMPTATSGASRRGEWGFWTVFGTAIMPTGTSEPSRRVEMVLYRTFGTATLPTDTSMASSRSLCELAYRIVAEFGFVKFTWHETLLIIK